jgi:uncharacterized membrane protein
MSTLLNGPIHTQFRTRARRSRARRAVTRSRPSTWRGAIVPGLLLGAASGARAQLGVATVVARSDPALPSMFLRPWTRRLLMAAAAGELVVDKVPTSPSRLEPPGIAARLVMGALAASLFAQTRQAPLLPAATIGASSAAVAAKLGHDVRARLAQYAPDPAIAVGEDVLAIGLAAAGASR